MSKKKNPKLPAAKPVVEASPLASVSDAEVMAFLRGKAHEELDKGDKRNARAFTQRLARDTLFVSQVEAAASLLPKVAPSGYSVKKNHEPIQRALNLIISDTHFHALLDDREVPYRYGPVEEARRLAKVVLETAEYKVQYRAHTELNVNIIGDIIQGKLHDPADAAPLALQIAAAAHLLTQAIAFLAAHFPKVTVRCATGNHGRNVARHRDRATTQKWDSNETHLYISLKHALSNLKNVTVEIPKTPYFSYKVFDKRIFGTHGDNVLNPGNPGQAIKTGMLEQQVNRINAALPDDQEYAVFFCGHVHIGSLVHLPNGSTMITNGCLIPSDSYGTSLGLFEVTCGQTLFESVKGFAAGDYRFIYVDQNTDKDKSLDEVVKPYLTGAFV
jgi:hypothetical protein